MNVVATMLLDTAKRCRAARYLQMLLTKRDWLPYEDCSRRGTEAQ
jgi:hypothetical protein